MMMLKVTAGMKKMKNKNKKKMKMMMRRLAGASRLAAHPRHRLSEL
jgi:hypothetical protein